MCQDSGRFFLNCSISSAKALLGLAEELEAIFRDGAGCHDAKRHVIAEMIVAYERLSQLHDTLTLAALIADPANEEALSNNAREINSRLNSLMQGGPSGRLDWTSVLGDSLK
jgi:16S rRNA C1402 N4-methylase RsmH